jgi:FAD:protein FMN transferase
MNPKNGRKNLIYSLILVLLVVMVYLYRSWNSSNADNPNSPLGLDNMSGEFLSQPYLVLFHSGLAIEKNAVDSILGDLSSKLSLNLPSSELFQLNEKDTIINPSVELLSLLRTAATEAYRSQNAWDPTQVNLTKIWTFSSLGAKLQDSVEVSDFLSKTGINKLIISDSLIRKTTSGINLDLTDYGQALAIDRLSEFFDREGIRNYFLQIGRHTRAKGVNEKKELWKAKTSYPFDSIGMRKEGWIAIENRAISVSGDFSSFYFQDSLRKAFRIDPRSGYPVNHGLLGVSVLARDSKTAALISETLMVQGWQEGISLDSARKDLEMILIFNDKGTGIQVYASPGLKPFLSFPVE